MSDRDNKIHTMQQALEILKKAAEWAEIKREAEKQYKALANPLKAFMAENGLDTLTTPEGVPAKLSERNQGSWDRTRAMEILDSETFTQIFTTKRIKQLKVG
jgi:hypothetical protein